MNKKKIKVGILGVGEVGRTIKAIVEKKYDLYIKDVDYDTIKDQKLEVLHICIPYTTTNQFEKIVIAQIKLNKPSLTIIESTVPVGVTEKIAKRAQTPVVHSPIRGDHKTMVADVKKFTKFIGASSSKDAKRAAEYYTSLGMHPKVVKSPRTTEMGKLLDTTYYAVCIAWHQEMERFCKKFGISFDEAVTQFNLTYNEGYNKTKPHVIRPVLTPGFIGGHCLMPNITLLKTFLKSDFLDLIEESNAKKAKEHAA